MPMIARGTGDFTHFRLLISGLSMTGKTWSLYTFDEDDKSLVVLSCPGETGTRSIQPDTERVHSHYFTNISLEDRRKVEWCKDSLSDFDKLYLETVRNAPDKLFIDGAHNLYELDFNIITGGLFLSGVDLRSTGNSYAAAAFYSRGHTAFGNRLKTYYDSTVPFVGLTTWERLIGAVSGDEGGKGNKINISDDRYWWPAIPGDMATKVVGFFDARISARLEKRCLHPACEDSKVGELHHVWQFYPKNDVAGIGIKGLRISEAMKQKPWIHQSWAALRTLLSRKQQSDH